MCAQSVKNFSPLRCVLSFLEAAAGVCLTFSVCSLFVLQSSSETHQQSAAAVLIGAPAVARPPTPPTLAAPAPATAPEADGQPQAECEIAKDSFQKGTKVNKAGNHNEAYQFFSQGLSTARTVELQSALLVSRSAALCGMNRYQEALVDAVECVKIRKSWARSYSCQEAALNGLGRTEEAGRCRRLASALANLKQDPKNEVISAAESPCLLNCPGISCA